MVEKEKTFPRQHIRRWRLLVQAGAFLLLIITPLVNYYLHIHFVQGWYQSLGIGKLWFVSPLEGLESLLVAKIIYLPLLIGMVVPVLVAFFLGRVFCGWICPVHFLSDMSDRLIHLFARKKRRKDRLLLPRQIFWFVLVADIFIAMVLGAPLFVIFSPPGLIGREIMRAVFFHTLALEGLIVVAVLIANLVTSRFFCRYFCPLGALLALIGGKRRLRIHHDQDTCTECGLCQRSCPLGLNPALKEGASLYCWNCGECVEVCGPGALCLRWETRSQGQRGE
ncbi:MAG: 4Fe-4S binding protein [Desulfobulbaceae bacterium]|uniref:4Fe-4S binding protein n=1 Tax=Candidatus Desulfobia pelagia TaxID=2841692 RepID=A0A8J6NF94_9BACT|nr:4Fe-4S binding protein [Candidatus Desulfobia pelagia]